MSEQKEGHRVTDDQLVAAARDGSVAADVVQEMAAEVLRWRRTFRIESRRAGQVKKFRWSIEALLRKVEELELGDDPSTRAQREPPWLADAARAIGEVAPGGEPLALNWTQVLRSIESLRGRFEAAKLVAKAYTAHLPTCRRTIGSNEPCTCGLCTALDLVDGSITRRGRV